MTLHRPSQFHALLTIRVISMTGTGVNLVVMAWLVLAVGGDAWDLALMITLSAAGASAASALCGSFIDKIPRRHVAAAAEFLRIIPSIAIPLLAASGSLRLWQLLLVSPLINGAQIVSGVAYGALLPVVVPRDRLGQANGFWQSAQQVGAFVGAAVAGAIIPVLGSAQTLWVEVALRLATCAGLLTLVPTGGISRTARDRASSAIREVTEAWVVLRGRPQLLWITLFTAIPGSLIWAVNVVLAPFAKQTLHGGATGYGLLDAAWGAGAFVAGILFARRPNAHQSRRLHVWALLLTGVLFALFGAAPDLPVAIPLSAFAGGATLVSLVLHQAYTQAEAPEAQMGRILAMAQFAVSLLWLISALSVGALALVVPLRDIIVVWGVLIVVGGGLLALLLHVSRHEAPSVEIPVRSAQARVHD